MYGYLPRFISNILQFLNRLVSVLPPPLNVPEIFLLTVIIIALASTVIVVLIKGRKQPESFEIPGLEEALPKPSGKVEEAPPPKPVESFEVSALPPQEEPEKEEEEELPFWIREKIEEKTKPPTTDVQDLEKRLEMALRAAEKPAMEEKPPEEPRPLPEKPPEEPRPLPEKPPEERLPLEIPTSKPLEEEFKPGEAPKLETKPLVSPSIEPGVFEMPELTEAEISYLDNLKNQLLSISSKVSEDKEKGYICDTLKDKILSMIREDISNIDKIIAAAKIKLLQRKKKMIEMEYKERFKEIERQLMELRKQLGM